MFEESVKTYYDVDTRHKELGKQRTKLNNIIKNHLAETGEETVEVDNLVVKRGVQERTSMDKDKAVEILKSMGMSQAIKTVEVPDEEALDNLIFSGDIQPADLAPAITVKEVVTLSVKPKKVKRPKPKKQEVEASGTDEVF